jgi:Reverse transcriptase (RNA-dependent DNA polymerase)
MQEELTSTEDNYTWELCDLPKGRKQWDESEFSRKSWTVIEETFMKPPPGREQSNNKVYLLKESLKGLKQAARVWNQT